MKHFALNGQVREASNKAAIKEFRKQGLVPCNIYGAGIENVLFTITEKDLKGLTETPASYIVDLELSNGKKYFAVLHELQFHPVKDNALRRLPRSYLRTSLSHQGSCNIHRTRCRCTCRR